jgi:hypothetical protein
MKKLCMTLSVALALTGCMSVKDIAADGKNIPAGMRGSPVAISVVKEPLMDVMTPGSVAGTGIVPGVIDSMTRPDGTRLAMPSPSYLVAQALRERLPAVTGLTFAEVPSDSVKARKKGEVYVPGKPTLEVYVDTNSLSYRPLAWQTYQYMLLGHATLLDSNGRVVWQNTCDVGGVSADTTLQLDRSEFAANDGQKLKDIMLLAANRCADELSRMGAPDPPGNRG